MAVRRAEKLGQNTESFARSARRGQSPSFKGVDVCHICGQFVVSGETQALCAYSGHGNCSCVLQFPSKALGSRLQVWRMLRTSEEG